MFCTDALKWQRKKYRKLLHTWFTPIETPWGQGLNRCLLPTIFNVPPWPNGEQCLFFATTDSEVVGSKPTPKNDLVQCIQCTMLGQLKDPGHLKMNRALCARLPIFSSIIMIWRSPNWRVLQHGNLGLCFHISSALRCCSMAALSCTQWKAHHKFPHSIYNTVHNTLDQNIKLGVFHTF